MTNQQQSTSNAAWVTRVVLIWLSVQNATSILLMRYSRSRHVDKMYLPSVAVFFTEIMKLAICLVAVAFEEGGIIGGTKKVLNTVFMQPVDTLLVCVPSLIYTVQNNLFYLAASHLDAATFMVTAQLKIFTSAMFAVLMMGQRLSARQWVALVVLFGGVSLVQLQTAAPSTAAGNTHHSQNPLIGLGAIVIASTLSGFAGVYFERVLKKSASTTGGASVWLRNVQLAVCAVPIAWAAAATKDGAALENGGALQGFDWVVWLTAAWAAIGGLTVAVVIKLADNVAKNFATSVAILLATVISVVLFDFTPTLAFVVGAALVIASIFLYSAPATKQSDKKKQ